MRDIMPGGGSWYKVEPLGGMSLTGLRFFPPASSPELKLQYDWQTVGGKCSYSGVKNTEYHA